MKPKRDASCSSRCGTRSKGTSPTDFAACAVSKTVHVCENLWLMLQFLNISNIALIDDMQVEFESGLNLLTGETGSGKSIIVDALGVLIGGRFSSDLIKSGAERGSIEGLFSVTPNPDLELLLENAGFGSTNELIIRRDREESLYRAAFSA